MSRQYLTGLNLNKNELLNARIQNLGIAPSSPVVGQIYYDTDLGKLRQWDGAAWLTYVTSDGGGQYITSVGSNLAVTAGQLTLGAKVVITDGSQTLTNKVIGSGTTLSATIDANGNTITDLGAPSADTDAATKKYVDDEINLLSTADIEEDSTHLYFTDTRAKTSAASLLTGATKTNITITGDETGLTITAENGVADSTTSDLAEGTNLYFTTERAQDAVGNSVGNGISYNDTTGAISANLGTGLEFNAGAIDVDTDTIATKTYVGGEITTHAGVSSNVHGVTGSLVGTSDTQSLTNKTLGSGTVLSADLDADGFKITSLAAPTSANDAANKQYVDDAVAGLSWKAAVNLLADSNVALTGTSGSLVIDGHGALDSADTGYRILLTAQTTDSQNGIYVYADAGSGYTLSRADDADTFGELIGATVFVQEGTAYGTSSWVQSNHYLTDFTAQDWVQFSGASQITAGDGLTKSGNVINAVGTTDRVTVTADAIDIASTYVGQSSITTVGTITTGTWNGTDIAVADGGTGASNAADARANLGATTKYAEGNAELIPSGGIVTWSVAHNLGTSDVVVQLRQQSNGALVEVDVLVASGNAVTLSWNAAATVAADTYRVVVVG